MDKKEQAAAVAHNIWAEWMNHFSKATIQMEGRGKTVVVVIGIEDWQRWARQADTDYRDLLEYEKMRDRDVGARHVLPLLEELQEKIRRLRNELV